MKYLLQLKAIKIAVLLLLATATTQAQTNYKVFVPQSYLTKNYLVSATDNIPNRGRYIAEKWFELVLEQEHAETYVRSVFESAEIPVLNVTSSKIMIPFREKAGGNNCEAAELLCSNTSQTANSGGAGTQELTGANQGCLGTEHQSSWYYLNIQTGGTLTMTINPNSSSDDYDFAIWGPFTTATAGTNCPPISAPARCSYSACTGPTGIGTGDGCWSCGFFGLSTCYGPVTGTGTSESASGDSWISALSTSANQVYILLVDNFSNSGQPYNLSFGGTSVLGCTPVVLPIVLADFNVAKTSQGNRLSWVTETEDRTDYFTVEWTTDPASGDWKELANVPAQGYSQENYHYNTIHEAPSVSEINYYRLNLIDLDGSKTTFSAKMLSADNSRGIKKVERVFNTMGQEVDENCKGVVIYYYSDGTTERMYR